MSDHDAFLICLDAVLTVQECATIYSKNPKSVMLAIWKGRLTARQSSVGATWLISRAAATKLWGEPKNGKG